MAKISVIIAAYNDEKHIDECLDSLAEQTLSDIQIICVDDCSTDSTLDIIQRHASTDKRIHVIHLDKNQGQAKARNAGLSIASGQYITFLDSDDWLSVDALENVVSTFSLYPDTDTVLLHLMLCSGNRKSYNGKMFKNQDFEKLPGKKAFELSLNWSIHGVYATRKELFDRFPYDDTCHAYSDDNTTRAHYLHSREVRICDGIYFYRKNPYSTTNKISARRFLIMQACESMKKMLGKWEVEKRLKAKYENVCWMYMIDLCKFYYLHAKELTESERRFGLSEIRKAWRETDRTMLETATTHKFGYMPMPCWTLFWLQELAYFTLRQFTGRNKE